MKRQLLKSAVCAALFGTGIGTSFAAEKFVDEFGVTPDWCLTFEGRTFGGDTSNQGLKKINSEGGNAEYTNGRVEGTVAGYKLTRWANFGESLKAPFTVTFWGYAYDMSDKPGHFFSVGQRDNSYSLGIAYQNADFGVRLCQTNDRTPTFGTHTWNYSVGSSSSKVFHHYAMVVEERQASLYVDGEFIGTEPFVWQPNPKLQFCSVHGGTPTGMREADHVTMDDFRVYSRAFDAVTVKAYADSTFVPKKLRTTVTEEDAVWSSLQWTDEDGNPVSWQLTNEVTINAREDAQIVLDVPMNLPKITVVGDGRVELVADGSTDIHIDTYGIKLSGAVLLEIQGGVQTDTINLDEDAVLSLIIPEGSSSVLSGKLTGKGSIEKGGAGELLVDADVSQCGGFNVIEGSIDIGINPAAAFTFAPGVTWRASFGGKRAILDIPFSGSTASSGQNALSLTCDSSRSGLEYYDNALNPGAILGYSRPWANFQIPIPGTVALYGVVPRRKDSPTVFASFGGYERCLFLASGETANEVTLNLTTGNSSTYTTLTKMSVPNATSTKHLYVFSMPDNKTVEVYLDGVKNLTYKAPEAFSINPGIQLGGWYGGSVNGYTRPDAVEDGGLFDQLYVYDRAIGSDTISLISDAYPYISESGRFTRTFAGNGNWSENGTWVRVGTEDLYGAPQGGQVEITATADSTISMNGLGELESLKVSGTGSVRFTENSGGVSCLGLARLETDVTIENLSMKLNGPVTLAPGKTLTFDLSSLDATLCHKPSTVQMTGLVDNLGEAVVFVPPSEPKGRTFEFGYDEASETYVMTISLSREPTELYWQGTGEGTLTPDTILLDADGNEQTFFYADDALVITSDVTLTDEIGIKKIIVRTGGRLRLANGAGTLHDYDDLLTIQIDEGGVFDGNGAEHWNPRLVHNGGTFANYSGHTNNNGHHAWYNEAFLADSRFDAGENAETRTRLIGAGYGTINFNLNGYTLDMIGAGIFEFYNAKINGGTIVVGNKELWCHSGSLRVTANEALNFVVKSGSQLTTEYISWSDDNKTGSVNVEMNGEWNATKDVVITTLSGTGTIWGAGRLGVRETVDVTKGALTYLSDFGQERWLVEGTGTEEVPAEYTTNGKTLTFDLGGTEEKPVKKNAILIAEIGEQTPQTTIDALLGAALKVNGSTEGHAYKIVRHGNRFYARSPAFSILIR